MARYFTRLRLVKYLAISHADSCNKSYVVNGPKITCAEFGVKMFVRVRDTAANVMYYAMGIRFIPTT